MVGYKLRSDNSSAESNLDSDEETGDNSLRRKKSVTFKQSAAPFNIGDPCRVKSNSLGRWLPAKVTDINYTKKTLEVRYTTPQGDMKKDLPFDSKDLHFQSESEGTPLPEGWDQTTNSKGKKIYVHRETGERRKQPPHQRSARAWK